MLPQISRSVLLALAGALLIACKEPPPTGVTDRAELWRGDLTLLRAEALRLHPLLNAAGATRDAFLHGLDSLDAAVHALSDFEIGTGLQRLLVAIGDGHTTLLADDVGLTPFLALRTDFYWFDDGVYIVSVRPGLGALYGARVTAVGGVPIAAFQEALQPFIPQDNAQTARWLGAQLMQYPVLVRAAGAAATDSVVALDLVDAGGVARSVPVTAHEAAALPRLHPPTPGSPSTPRYLQNLDQPFWLDSLPADSALYLGFNAVADGAETLAAFAARLDALTATGRFRDLIVDVRLNSGGNGFLLPPLLDALARFEAHRTGNRLFVLIGRATFSAAQTFVTRLDVTTDAIFVGEPTGSRPNHIGDVNEFRLPYSHLLVTIASARHDDSAPDDMRPWVAPDVAVPVLAADYFGNRDPAFDSVLVRVRQRP